MTTTSTTPLPTVDQHDAAGIAHALEEDGFALIPGVLNAEEVAEARRRIDELTHFGFDRASEDGRGRDHWKCIFNRHPYWLRFIDQPGIIDGIEQVLGSNCHITGHTAWRTFPGDGAERPGLHVDQLLFPVPEELAASGRVRIPCYLATLHFYLSDISEDLCPTWIVPGSHKSGRGPGSGQPNANNPTPGRGFLAGEWSATQVRTSTERAGPTFGGCPPGSQDARTQE